MNIRYRLVLDYDVPDALELTADQEAMIREQYRQLLREAGFEAISVQFGVVPSEPLQ